MSNQNIVALQGNLVRDAELVGPEKNVARFSIAVNNGFGENKSTTFVDCVAFGKTAEIIGQHFAKGKQVLINGQLHQNNWEDKDGNKRSKLEVRVNSFNGFSFVSGNSGQASEGAPSDEPVAAATEGGSDGDGGDLF